MYRLPFILDGSVHCLLVSVSLPSIAAGEDFVGPHIFVCAATVDCGRLWPVRRRQRGRRVVGVRFIYFCSQAGVAAR